MSGPKGICPRGRPGFSFFSFSPCSLLFRRSSPQRVSSRRPVSCRRQGLRPLSSRDPFVGSSTNGLPAVRRRPFGSLRIRLGGRFRAKRIVSIGRLDRRFLGVGFLGIGFLLRWVWQRPVSGAAGIAKRIVSIGRLGSRFFGVGLGGNRFLGAVGIAKRIVRAGELGSSFFGVGFAGSRFPGVARIAKGIIGLSGFFGGLRSGFLGVRLLRVGVAASVFSVAARLGEWIPASGFGVSGFCRPQQEPSSGVSPAGFVPSGFAGPAGTTASDLAGSNGFAPAAASSFWELRPSLHRWRMDSRAPAPCRAALPASGTSADLVPSPDRFDRLGRLALRLLLQKFALFFEALLIP